MCISQSVHGPVAWFVHADFFVSFVPPHNPWQWQANRSGCEEDESGGGPPRVGLDWVMGVTCSGSGPKACMLEV